MDSGAITALGARAAAGHRAPSPVGFDLTLGVGPRARLRRARAGRADVVPVQDRALRDGAQGRRHGARALPALVWHLEDPRVGQSYPNFYVGAARQQVREGRALGRRRRRAVRRLSVALLPRRRQRRLRPLRRQVLRLLAAADARTASCDEFFRPVSGDGGTERSTSTSSASVFDDARGNVDTPEDYVNHSLYFEAKTFLHGLLVVEDKLSMAHGLETRRAVPRQRPRRLRAGRVPSA